MFLGNTNSGVKFKLRVNIFGLMPGAYVSEEITPC